MSRQYISAGRIVDEVLDGSRSFKSVAHSSDGISNKVEYLLAAQTLKYKATLFSLLETVLKNQGGGSNLESLFTETQKGIFLVMLYELLFSAHKSIHGGGRVKKMIMQKYAENLKALASSRNDNVSHEGIDQEQNTLDQLHHPIEPIVPQYIRINQVKTAIDEGFEYVRNKFPDEEKVSVVLDDLITGLVKISSQNSLPGHSPMKARLTGDDPFVRDGSLIIQDKASCFPSQLLFNCWKQANLPLSGLNLPSLHVLDACAAPGNKTTHLAALFSSLRTSYPNLTYRITAVEKDGTRSELLQRRVTQAGVKGQVRVVNEDFLQLDVKDGQYKDVSAVLLDPSCSGSGMHGRTSEHQSPAEQEQLLLRVEKLRRFQLQCLLKAMGFGQAELVVYSTCSVHLQENEAVVAEALHWQRNWAQGKAAAGGGWRLVEPVGFESWERRGEPIPVGSFSCIRYDTSHCNKAAPLKKGKKCKLGPKEKVNKDDHSPPVMLSLSEDERRCLLRCFPEDGTGGFFVAVFRRVKVKPEPGTVEVKEEPGIKMEDEDRRSARKGNEVCKKAAKRKRVSDLDEEEEWVEDVPVSKHSVKRVAKASHATIHSNVNDSVIAAGRDYRTGGASILISDLIRDEKDFLPSTRNGNKNNKNNSDRNTGKSTTHVVNQKKPLFGGKKFRVQTMKRKYKL